jgi:tetratricopeptide (TPR) repeat protein
VLGLLNWLDRRYADSADALQTALRIDPNDITSLFWTALGYCQVGATGACERALDHVLMLDPLLPNALGWRSRLYAAAGELEKAEQTVARAREAGLRWAEVGSSRVAMRRGDRATAQAQFEAVHEIFGAGLPPEAATIFAAARAGDVQAHQGALAIIDGHLATGPARINALVPLTLVSMGEIERGLALFTDYATTNDALFLGEIMDIRSYPEVWTSPAFPVFLRQTGLADYWARFGAPQYCRKDANGDYRCEWKETR